MKIVGIFFLIVMLLINSCKETPTDPSEKEDIVPQTNIPWASLAETPWPMNHHDPQSTGRSQYAGPQAGVLASKITYYGIESSLALGKNNEIFTTANYYPHRISALTLSGDTLWENLSSGNIATTPLVSDSTIFWADASGLNAFTLNGKRKWKYDHNCSIWNIGINRGLDGTIYCVTKESVLKAISPKGYLLWELKDKRFRAGEHGAPTFSPDGKTLYIQGNSVSVLAVNIDKHKVKWIYGNKELLSSPVVDSDGNIYFIPGQDIDNITKTLYSLDKEGAILWEFNFDDGYILDNIEPTIDKNGNVFFGASTLFSVNHQGKLRWKYNLKNLNIVSPLVNDVNGNIFIGAADLTKNSELSVFSFDNKGTLNWKIKIEGENFLGASPVITKEQQLLVPSFRAASIIIIN